MSIFKHKLVRQWYFLLACFIFSGNAFSTILELNLDSIYLDGGNSYEVMFDFPDYNDASDVTLSFKYGLWAAGSGEQVDISTKINGNNLGQVHATAGYVFPGFEFTSMILSAADLMLVDNVLLFETSNLSSGGAIAEFKIGDIKLTYNNVPVPETLFLVIIGIAGLISSRNKSAIV